MKKKRPNHSARRRLTDASIARALNAAARDAVELHRLAGIPLAAWKDGKVAFVSVDEVPTRRKRANLRGGKSR